MYRKTNALSLAAVALCGAAAIAMVELQPAMAEKSVTVGGAPMYASKNIIENAMNSKDHTTLVAAVKAAGLVDTLSGEGPFTVFAPTNAAFDKLPKGTVENLLKPENKEQLKKILTYHVIGGKAPTSAAITKMTKDDDNAHPVKMVSGDQLTTTIDDGKLKIKDESGNVATVTIADVKQSNGVIHVIDTVLLPKS
ncbi:MAG: fasciclin domain-containing protein [Alphaproteobacteria bacterium]|nr:fasciclin domain-containing protein [Alphaproteobacteria bacterium]